MFSYRRSEEGAKVLQVGPIQGVDFGDLLLTSAQQWMSSSLVGTPGDASPRHLRSSVLAGQLVFLQPGVGRIFDSGTRHEG